MSSDVKPTVFQMFERRIGEVVLVVTKNDLGFEGVLSTVSNEPPGVWLTQAKIVTLRSTIANPLPRVVNKIDKSDFFIHLNSVLRVEVLRKVESASRREE